MPAYAADVAQRWKDGLQSWGISPERLRWLQMATKYSIYTPGSDAGLPISIVASLRAPKGGWQAANEEEIREKINGITTALLALIGMNAEAMKDKEHVLIANIFEYNWRQGVDLTLEEIILQVQNPPFDKLGVFPIDQYISEKARGKLAMTLNSIVAAPSFQSWLQGQPLDIQSLLYQPNGRPRVSVFYTAHLSEAERQFITTLIAENMLGWMRTLSGTTSLRAIFYIDEMFGYFPPYPKNPPTKEPLLRLLKQARAFGIGLILATQNPGDLDYKGLTNAGTWFIGRLQSDNDRKKVMAGLQQMATADDEMDLDDVEILISDITPRVFLMRNVHDTAGPSLVHTRWAMNYLRGPLTRQQIEYLMRGQREQLMIEVAQRYAQQQMGGYGQQPGTAAWQQQAVSYAQSAPQGYGQQNTPPMGMPATNAPPSSLPGMPQPPSSMPGLPPMPGQQQQPMSGFSAQSAAMPVRSQTQPQVAQQNSGPVPSGFSTNQPPVPASVSQYYLPNRLTNQQAIVQLEQRTGQRVQATGGATLVYKPILLAQAVVRYQDKKANVYTARTYAYHVPDLQRAGLIHWEEYFADPVDARELASAPTGQAAFGDLPPGLVDNQRMKALQREVTDMLYNTAKLRIPYNPDLKVYGDPDGEFSEFQATLHQLAREQRDVDMDKLVAKYEKLMDRLEDRYRKKERELRAEKREISDRKREQLFTTGEAMMSLWKGRTNYTLSRMSRANRYREQTQEDIKESYEALEEIEQEMASLEQDFGVEAEKLNDKWGKVLSNVEEHIITAYKKDIQLELFGIGWMPSWYTMINNQPVLIDAF